MKIITSLYFKRFLKNSIFRVLSIINKCIPKDDKLVLLYISYFGIRHTLIPIRKYLVDNEFNKKYRIVCGIESLKYKDNTQGVEFAGKFRSILLFFRARHVFYTAGQIPIKPSKNQIVIHFSHGSANFKKMGSLTDIGYGEQFYFTYITATSKLYVPIIMEEFQCPEECVKIIGDPQNDQILSFRKGNYDFSQYDKLIVWVPTYRQSDGYDKKDSNLNTLIPLFDESDYPKLNSILSKYNIKLIVKLHISQICKDDKMCHFSHFDIYTHQEFINMGFEIYHLVADSDVLIGDYSSLSLQYLLTDRPQGYVVPDIEDYCKNRGIVFDDPEAYMGGHIIKTQEQFYSFIHDIAMNKDVFRNKRHWVADQIFEYKDANNCARAIALSEMFI